MFGFIAKLFKAIFGYRGSRNNGDTVNPHNATYGQIEKVVNRYLAFHSGIDSCRSRRRWEHHGYVYYPISARVKRLKTVENIVIGRDIDPNDVCVEVRGNCLQNGLYPTCYFEITGWDLLELCKQYNLYGDDKYRKDMTGNSLKDFYWDRKDAEARRRNKLIAAGKPPDPNANEMALDCKQSKQRYDEDCARLQARQQKYLR